MNTNVTNNRFVNQWISEMAELVKPDNIVLIDGSESQAELLRAEACSTGEMIKLNQDLLPGCYLHRTAINDVARVEDRTFICTSKKEDAGNINNWMAPDECYAKLSKLYNGSYKGRTMYVIPYSMSVVGSDFAKYGIELTDSIYVVLNMLIMTRVGLNVLEALGDSPDFIKGLHARADIDAEKRYICHFPEDNTIWSVNSGYGGNVLLGKKCFALRIASYLGRKEGWMAEHMLILGVNSPKSAVLTYTKPSNIVAYAPNLVALLAVNFRRNEHSKVGLTASGGECSGDVFLFAVRILYAENEHVLSHPALLASQVGSNTKRKALLAQETVSAVTGVYGPDGVVLGEVADVTVFLVNVSLGVKALDEVSALAQSLQYIIAYAGHDQHVQHHVDRVGQLNAILGKGRSNDAHGVGDYVHGTALHGAGIELGELCVALLGVHPVIDVSRILLFRGTNKSSSLNASHVVDGGSVQIAVGKKLLIQLNHFARGARLGAQSLRLLVRAVDPDDLVGLRHGSHFVDPIQDKLVLGHSFLLFKNI